MESGGGAVVVQVEGGRPRRTCSQQFTRICKAADVPAVRLHWLRHTLATIMHRSGTEAADAAAILGQSTAVHLTYYVTASQPGMSRAAERLFAALAQAR